MIAGPLRDDEAELFAGDFGPAKVVAAGSLERERALALQREADALLVVAHPTRSQLLNIKLFEYMASGRPVLALAEGTEAGRVVAETGGESVRGRRPRGDRGGARTPGSRSPRAPARIRAGPLHLPRAR